MRFPTIFPLIELVPMWMSALIKKVLVGAQSRVLPNFLTKKISLTWYVRKNAR